MYPIIDLTLAEVMDRRQLEMEEVLAWAPSIAAFLEELHREGRFHGEISPSTILVDGYTAILMPGQNRVEPAKHPQDIAQFAAVLKQMLQRTMVEDDLERAHWRVLDQIATNNANATEGSRMKKVSATLKLIRAKSRLAVRESGAPRPIRSHADEEEAETPEARYILLLVREVPPATPVTESKASAKPLHVWTSLASAVGVVLNAVTSIWNSGGRSS